MDLFGFLGIPNFDVFIIGFVALCVGTLGFVAYFSNPKSITNQTFLFVALTVIFWGALNLLVFKFQEPEYIIWMLRTAVFFATWHAFSVFTLFYVFPQPTVKLPFWHTYLLTPFVALVSLLTLSPFVFESVAVVTAGQVATVVNGPLVPLFGITVVLLHIMAFILLIIKANKAETAMRRPYIYILAGTGITYSLILIFNFIFPALLAQSQFAPLAGLFTLPFVFFTGYAVVAYKMIDFKVLATEILAGVLAIVMLAEVFTAKDSAVLVYKVSIFVLVLVFSYLLLRSVIREVQQREQIQHLADNLRQANEKLKELDKLKSEFLSIASHDLRAPLTVIRNYVSLVLDGSYGKMPKAAEEGLHQVFERATDMAKSVDTYLNVSRIERGRMKYDFIDVDLAPILKKAVKDFAQNAEKKGLVMNVAIAPGLEGKKAKVDVAKVNEILNNLLDNSIKYTPKGTISVSAELSGKTARITISDTGIGMTQETISKLFRLFSAGESSLKINISSTGVGLYITKAHVLAHKGRVWAESDGEGKGSRFILELPLLN